MELSCAESFLSVGETVESCVGLIDRFPTGVIQYVICESPGQS